METGQHDEATAMDSSLEATPAIATQTIHSPLITELGSISSPPSKKRKLSEEPHSSTPPPSDNLIISVPRPPAFQSSPDGLPYMIPLDVPMNRQGFRYTPARPSPPGSILSHRSTESQPAGHVRVSWEDRSPYVRVTTDGLGILGDKGFRSARLNVPVKEGKWYLEVRVEKGGGEGSSNSSPGAHVRLGWGRREAPLNGPAGMDGYSYAYRDKTGEKVNLARLRPYGRPFGSGDVIGLYISLPPRRQPAKNDPLDSARVVRKRVAINYKNQLYFESMDYAQTKEMITLMDLKRTSDAPSKKDAAVKDSQADKTSAATRRRKSKPMPKPEEPVLRSLPTLGSSSCIAFFVNGECQGPAFTDLYDYLQLPAATKKQQAGRRSLPAYLRERENTADDGSLGYYPFISVFEDARVSINAGPDFLFPPLPDIDHVLFPDNTTFNTTPTHDTRAWRPLCERYAEFTAEEAAQDELDELEAQKKHEESQRQEQLEETREAAREAKKVKLEPKKNGTKKPFTKKKSGLSNEMVASEDPSGISVPGAFNGTPSGEGPDWAGSIAGNLDADSIPGAPLEGLPGPSTSPADASFGPIAHGHIDSASGLPSPWADETNHAASQAHYAEAATPSGSAGPSETEDEEHLDTYSADDAREETEGLEEADAAGSEVELLNDGDSEDDESQVDEPVGGDLDASNQQETPAEEERVMMIDPALAAL